MPERSVTHATFTIERVFDFSPAEVFAAYADPASRRRWFVEGEGWDVETCHLDFRQGASEHSTFRFRGGPLIRNDTTYLDIVENRRFVFAYTMAVGDDHISASLGTVELIPEGNGTRHLYTEQGAYLDGHDNVAQREEGSRQLFEALARELGERRKAA
jgi:uncharacterized protein YndB with AHSA1/START domain